MNCRYARANFSGYIEQELSEAERREVAAHLARCAKCTSELFAMQKAMSLVRWVPRYEGSPGFEERLMRRIAVEARQPARRAWWREARAALGAHWDDLVAAMMVPAPVGALVVALVLGGGGGAFLVRSMNERSTGAPVVTAQGPAATPVVPVATPAATPVAAPAGTAAGAPTAPEAGPTLVASREPATESPAPGRELAAAETKDAAPAPAPAARAARSRPLRPQLVATAGGASGAADVADWRAGGQPIEAIPEGPPAVSEVEYILHLIDANGQLIELPASAIVSGGTVTF